MDVSVIRNDQGKEELFRMLDRGIDDMEEGRELPLEEAFNAVDRLVGGRKVELYFRNHDNYEYTYLE